MTAKKKTKHTSSRSKKSARKSSSKQPAQKTRTPRKLAKRKTVPKKAAANKKAPAKTASIRIASATNKKGRNPSRQPGSSPSSPESSGLQAGDLQGLSNVESVDSESVDELIEEGNAFEAGVISGVEDSREREGKEVRTREVPEDDVPGEYLDEE
jgi:hypothetical protein